jgi:hypothetical protein
MPPKLLHQICAVCSVDVDLTSQALPPGFELPRNKKLAAKVTHDIRAFKAAKQGLPVQISDGEHLAGRMLANAEASSKCDCCNLCCDGLCSWLIGLQQAREEEQRHKIALRMDPSQACVNMHSSKYKCYRREAQIAVAVGKEGAHVSLLGDDAVGIKLAVRIYLMHHK